MWLRTCLWLTLVPAMVRVAMINRLNMGHVDELGPTWHQALGPVDEATAALLYSSKKTATMIPGVSYQQKLVVTCLYDGVPNVDGCTIDETSRSVWPLPVLAQHQLISIN